MSDEPYTVKAGMFNTDGPGEALRDKVHYWVIDGLWHVANPQAILQGGYEIDLDHENLIKLSWPLCLFCGKNYGDPGYSLECKGPG